MLLSEISEEMLTTELIDKILFDNKLYDDGKNADCIFVFCSRKHMDQRALKAVEVYMNKRAPKILFSGGIGDFGRKNSFTIPESVIMKDKAVDLGVNVNDIIIEPNSNNTKENVLFSMRILDDMFSLANVKRIIVVSTISHLRRCSLTLSRYMPKWIEYSYIGTEREIFDHYNWRDSLEGRERITKEVTGIIKYAKLGDINDLEIH